MRTVSIRSPSASPRRNLRVKPSPTRSRADGKVADAGLGREPRAHAGGKAPEAVEEAASPR
jgi:hypothetical protein